MNNSKTPVSTFLGLRKLPARYAGFVMPLLLSILMTCIVSLISTFKGVGWVPPFLEAVARRLGRVVVGGFSYLAGGVAPGAQAHCGAGGYGRCARSVRPKKAARRLL